MWDSLVSSIDWIATNKEWLFSGAGLLVISLFGSAIVLLWKIARNRQFLERPKKPVRCGQANSRRAAALSSFFLFFAKPYRWFVGRVREIQRRVADKEIRRKESLYKEMAESTVFFSHRFAEAFPGCRDLLVIDDPAEAIRRLDILLRKPLSIRIEHKGGSFGMAPIWWFRGWHHSAIRSYKKIRKYLLLPTNDILLNGTDVHRVRRVVAFGSMAYWANAVYIETDGVPPSGLYEHVLSEYAKHRGYNYEEVGVYKGRVIRREEYDDGAAVINGKVVSTLGKAKLQVRYLSPFNFFIVPVASPINDNQYDRIFEEAFKAVLQGRMSVERLAELVRRLPRNPKEDFMPQRVQENLAKL